MNFEYAASVIVPVYNVENFIKKCLDSLVSQTVDKTEIEVILVDDGSKDSSGAICDEYAQKYDFFKVFHNENSGVSAARNFGIDHSHGKYIIFLDSDDYLSKKSLKHLVTFFDKHSDETDLVTYKEMLVKDDTVKPARHFRYNNITKSAVYDLNDEDYMFFIQTHMNICVKNRGENNIKFDTTMVFHEDQKYILSNLADKNKIGFCESAEYYYVQNSDGASGMYSHPYYIFDKTMEFWESFLKGGNNRKYVQAYYLNDFRWKIRCDVLWPYQYKGEEFDRQCGRIIDLLKNVDDDVIMNFPTLIPAHKTYILSLKYGDSIKIVTDEDSYHICHNDESLLDFENIEIYVSRFHVRNNYLTMVGVIKCLACNFTDDISLDVTYHSKTDETVHIPLKYSSLSICASQTKTNNYKMFVIKRPIGDIKRIDFDIKLMGKLYPTHFTYPAACPFNRQLKRESYICEDMLIKCKNSHISFKKVLLYDKLNYAIRNIRFAKKVGFRNTMTRFIAPSYKKKNRIWLYCDSSKTVKDNAYYQFLHDVKKKDGIQRYYVYNPEADISGWFDESEKPYLIAYGSVKHRLYGLSAEKILTSFYGLRDILSYPYGAFKYFSDLTNFDVIYLQHGVLHAHLPTMYSLDRMMLDKEVISTNFEKESLCNNYCFEESCLIKSGMPRYNHIDKSKVPEKKILFAPSWRKFLVQPDGKGSWKPKEKAFLKSEFYQNINAFLTDPKLIKALEDNGYVLDFKPHPNFRMYDEYFKVNGKSVRLAEKTVDEFSYNIFITDFSSFVFDFVYLKRPILYFIPDMELFDAGLNHYRKLDMPFEDAFGELVSSGDSAVDAVIKLVENGAKPEQKYMNRMDGLFFDVDDHEEALYKELLKD